MTARRSSRIINVSSFSHASPSLDLDNLMSERSYSPWGAYSQVHSCSVQQSRSQHPESLTHMMWIRPSICAHLQGKLAQVLFTYELARRLKAESKLTCNACNPGLVKTNIQR